MKSNSRASCCQLLVAGQFMAILAAEVTVGADVAGVSSSGSASKNQVDMRLYDWKEDNSSQEMEYASHSHKKRWNKIYRQHSGLQLIEVMFDRVRNVTSLYLDRALQLTTTGEHMYHEMMAHVPLTTLKYPPKDILIIGAGDGGVTLRALRHPSVKRVVQIELDPAVVNVSRRFFPELSIAYDDPRTDLKIHDAISWAISQARSGERDAFDVCIIDSTDDPLGGPWTSEFFASLRQLLRPGGLLMQNIQSLDVAVQFDRMHQLHRKGGFELVRPVLISTIDYGSPYIAYLSSGTDYFCADPVRQDEHLLQTLACTWYSPIIHRASLAVPPAMMIKWPHFQLDADLCLTNVQSIDETNKPNDPDLEKDVQKVDYVIVGAGLSGLVAAHVLSRLIGAGSVLVLEATPQIGGRIETSDPTEFGGIAANIGANWIHYARNNPVTELAHSFGCTVHRSQNANLRWSASGVGALPDSAVESAREFVRFLEQHLAPLLETKYSPLEDKSAADFFANAMLQNQSIFDIGLVEAAARHLHMFTDVVQDHTARLRDMSASRICSNRAGGELSSHDVMLGGNSGANCLLKGLVDGFPKTVEIRTGHVVRKILRRTQKAGGTSVEAVVQTANTSATVTTYRVRADAAILTVPLGVLQASLENSENEVAQCQDSEAIVEDKCKAASPEGSSAEDAKGIISFTPRIPEVLARRWRRRGFGQSLRVALLFKEVFWDPTVEYFGHLIDFDVKSHDEQLGKTPALYGDLPAAEFTSVLNSTGQPILLAEVNRVLADELQSFSDSEITDFLLRRALREMYPNVAVPEPLSVAVKRFGSNPFQRGALSYNALLGAGAAGARIGDEEDDFAPLWGLRLHFAGEHTSAFHKGTLDGALFSGIESAWSAACAVNGGIQTVMRPADLVRALSIFKVWFPSDVNVSSSRRLGCLERVSARLLEGAKTRRPGFASSSCAIRILDEFETYCRDFAEAESNDASDPMSKRTCLDQGD